jgi:hypothetical protein
MKLRHYAAGLASAAALALGTAGPAAAGGTPAFTCWANQSNVFLYGDGPGQGPVDWIIHTGDAFYGHSTTLVNGVFWSYGHTKNNNSDLWVRTGQLRC